MNLINEVEVVIDNSDQGGDGGTDLQYLTKMILESNFFGVSLTGMSFVWRHINVSIERK